MGDGDPPAPEQEEVKRWRFHEADRLGVPLKEANEFSSSDADIGVLRDLVEAGCDPRLAALIVL